MRHPGPVRDLLARQALQMLEDVRVRISMYMPDELELLLLVERPSEYHKPDQQGQQLKVAEDLTNFLMQRLGGTLSAPKDPRFSKTRRAIAKRRPKPPRGIKLEPEAAP